jgi:ribonucleoside-triphosphate reductase
LEKIENILINKEPNTKLSPIECHDIICHSADAVISAGLRRSALIVLFDKDDYEMAECKTGNWFIENPQRGRANNSAKLIEGQYTKDEYDYFASKIKQFGEPGFVLVKDKRFCTNPCVEIGFIPINPKTGNSAISMCNLCEINAQGINTKDEFLNRVKAAAIIGTLQAGYTDFSFLGKDTEELVREEALLGISITGWFDNPKLFNEEWLNEGAALAKTVNEELANKININPSARLTCVKPSGNASVILGTSSGIHPPHSKNYFRIMQLNKESNVSQWLIKNRPEMLEESVWSVNKTDYAVYVPISGNDKSIVKNDIDSIEHLEKIKFVQKNWVSPGTIKGRGYSDYITHNVSNTIDVQDWDKTFNYVWDNKEYFCGISFMPNTGDKIYRQAPFTSVLMTDELIEKYGEGCLFASGLIVDMLHAFKNDLWSGCDAIINKDFFLDGHHLEVIMKKDIIRRSKKYAKNYFKGDLNLMIECLKDVHLFHKWCSITRKSINVNVSSILGKPAYLNIDEMSAIACHGGACEI